MKVLEIILPVLVMILLGMACKRLKLLDQNGINNMKLLVTQIMLPVAIFHALATADYNKETGILVGIMFVMLVVSFSIGFLLRPLMPAERYRKYLPFMVSVYEGGSMAYPLYTSLCGAENLSQICAGYCRSSVWLQRLYGNARTGGKRGKDRSGKTVFQCNTYTGVYCKCVGNHCRTYRCGAEASCRTVCRYLYKCGEHSHHFHNLSYSAGGRIQH